MLDKSATALEQAAERYSLWASRRRNRGVFRLLQLAAGEYLIRRVSARQAQRRAS